MKSVVSNIMAIEYTMKLFIENVVRPSCLQRKITLEPGTPEILDPLLRCKLKYISSHGHGLVLNNRTRTRTEVDMKGGGGVGSLFHPSFPTVIATENGSETT
jgi:hypothetical protein